MTKAYPPSLGEIFDGNSVTPLNFDCFYSYIQDRTELINYLDFMIDIAAHNTLYYRYINQYPKLKTNLNIFCNSVSSQSSMLIQEEGISDLEGIHDESDNGSSFISFSTSEDSSNIVNILTKDVESQFNNSENSDKFDTNFDKKASLVNESSNIPQILRRFSTMLYGSFYDPSISLKLHQVSTTGFSNNKYKCFKQNNNLNADINENYTFEKASSFDFSVSSLYNMENIKKKASSLNKFSKILSRISFNQYLNNNKPKINKTVSLSVTDKLNNSTNISDDIEYSNAIKKTSYVRTKNKEYLERTVIRQDVQVSCWNILQTYLLPDSPKKIILNNFILSNIISKIEVEARIDDEIFRDAQYYIFQALESDIYPLFLKSNAYGNLSPIGMTIRGFFGFLVLTGALWVSFIFIFLDWQPKKNRISILVLYVIGWYLGVASYSSLDPILALLGYSECGDNGKLLKIQDHVVKKYLVKRASKSLTLIILLTIICTLFFTLVPGKQLTLN